MAAFFDDHPAGLNSPSSSTINKMCGHEANYNPYYFSELLIDQPETFENILHDQVIMSTNYNEGCVLNVSNKNSIEDQQYYDTTPMSKKRPKCNEGSSANSAQSKSKNNKKERKAKINGEEKKKATEEAPAPAAGYIHVRARRGQATDSHSLAERVRRERISARMKQLQALVPGCHKVTGKALMLDEIINYVQSLQNQVEFLSMKLAAMNRPMFYDFEMDLESFMVKPDHEQSSPTTNTNYALPQGDKQALWDFVDGQRQKIINQSGFNNNNNLLFSFH